ncbi:MAG: dienelactone hydrolase family protein [Phormidesmis sp.]
MTELITFQRPDGKSCSGYYGEPEGDSQAPGIVVIQEWWGLNEQIKGVADELIAEGYRVLVPDLYKGEVTLEAAEAQHKMETLDFEDATQQDIRGAAQYLQKASPDVAVMGFCMGGVLTMLSAIHLPEVDAAISWYGLPPEGAGDPGDIDIPLQGHFGEKDSFFPIAQVNQLEAKLTEDEVDYDFYRYPAEHAFGNETGDSYDPAAKEKAWMRSLAFLEKHIG